jgi:hypothetical protein
MPSETELFQENAELYNAKSKYKAEHIPIINGYYTFMFYTYVLLIIVLVYILYISVKINKYIKIIIFVCFITYPFIIYNIEEFIYNYYLYIVAFIRGESYNGKHTPIK